MTELEFQFPFAIAAGIVLVATAMAWFTMRMRREGSDPRRLTSLLMLRALFFIALVLLVGRPVWTAPDQEQEARDQVAILIDRSESMSVLEGDRTRYQQAVRFARDVVLPTIDQSRLKIRPVLFSEDAREVSGDEIATATPDGAGTNLGAAIVQAVFDRDTPPLVAIALTDGIVTHSADQSRAVAALVTQAVPVVGIGFGTQAGGRVVHLDDVDAPAIAEPGQAFRVTARLRATGDSMPPMQLLLLRDGRLMDRRSIAGFEGPRTWLESFDVSVESEGLHHFTVRLMPPVDGSVTVGTAEGTAMVRVVASGELRVLYVQGGLTWDYKFVNLAVGGDPTIRLSGLSRTASTSRFFENVQSDVDLVNGFPSTLDQLAEFRVVVLSNLRPGDLTPHQQQLLADFCGELGGGLLMIGGPLTFNASWRDSRLEDLLPVRFAVLGDRVSGESFSIRPTNAVSGHPVFQIADDGSSGNAWRGLPRFTHRAVVDEVKPAAEVWMESDSGDVLMASQRYGNGLASVICMQNLWRWRLARESNPEHFDRFWRQLLRYLAEAGREVLLITPSNPRPSPAEEVELMIEHRAAAGEDAADRRQLRLRVQDPQQREVVNLPIELEVGRSTRASFTADSAGSFTASLLGPGGRIVASREIHVRDLAAELATTSRNMETLRQLAGISGGFAVEAEHADDLPDRLAKYLDPETPPAVEVNYARPAGINGWILGLVLACISAEWLCRKRWGMM